jgi:hypothetical protein
MKTKTKSANEHKAKTDEGTAARFELLRSTKPREAAIVASLVELMLNAEERKGNYVPFTFISAEEKEVLFNVANAIDELASKDQDRDKAPFPQSTLMILSRYIGELDWNLHGRFMTGA